MSKQDQNIAVHVEVGEETLPTEHRERSPQKELLRDALRELAGEVYDAIPESHRLDGLLAERVRFHTEDAPLSKEQFVDTFGESSETLAHCIHQLIELNRDSSIRTSYDSNLSTIRSAPAAVQQFVEELGGQRHYRGVPDAIDKFFLKRAIEAYAGLTDADRESFTTVISSIPIEQPRIEAPEEVTLPEAPEPLPEDPQVREKTEAEKKVAEHGDKKVDEKANFVERVVKPALELAPVAVLGALGVGFIGTFIAAAVTDPMFGVALMELGTFAGVTAGVAGLVAKNYKRFHALVDTPAKWLQENSGPLGSFFKLLRTDLVDLLPGGSGKVRGAGSGKGSLLGFMKDRRKEREVGTHADEPPEPTRGAGESNPMDLSKGAVDKIEQSKIRSSDPEMFTAMWVTDAYVAASPRASVEQLSSYLEGVGAPAEVTESLYPPKTVEAVTSDGFEGIGKAEVKLSVTSGNLKLPLPVGHAIRELSVYDERGERLEFSGEIREGKLGGAIVNLPSGAAEVIYRTEKGEARLDTETLRLLRGYLPQFESYLPEHESSYAGLVDSLKLSDVDRARLDYQGMVSEGITYTYDPYVTAMQRKAGDALNEAIGGSLMGICDSLSYHVVRRFQNLDLPAIQIVGLVPNQRKGEFNTDAGHAQALLLAEEPLIFDPTLHASSLGATSQKLSWNERAETLLDIRAGTYRQAYEHAERMADELTNAPEDALKDPLSPFYLMKRVWHHRLVPRVAESGQGSPEGHNFEDAHSDDPKLAMHARALKLLSYKKGLDEKIAVARESGEFGEVYKYLERKPRVALLKESDISGFDLPEELKEVVGFVPKEYALAFVRKSAIEGQLSKGEVDGAIDWLSRQCTSGVQRNFWMTGDFSSRIRAPELSLEKLIDFVEEINLSKLSDFARYQLRTTVLDELSLKRFVSGQRLRERNIPTTLEGSRSATFHSEDRSEIHAAVRLLRRLEDTRKIGLYSEVSPEQRVQLCDLLCKAAGFEEREGRYDADQGASEEFLDDCFAVLGKNIGKINGWADYLVKKFVLTHNGPDKGAMIAFIKSEHFPQSLKKKGEQVATAYLEHRLRAERNIWARDLKGDIELFKDLDFQNVHFRRQQKLVERLISIGSADSNFASRPSVARNFGRLDWDTTSRPVTALASHVMGSRAIEGFAQRNIATLVELSGLSRERALAAWKPQSEDEVAARFSGVCTEKYGGGQAGAKRFRFGKDGKAVEVFDVPALAEYAFNPEKREIPGRVDYEHQAAAFGYRLHNQRFGVTEEKTSGLINSALSNEIFEDFVRSRIPLDVHEVRLEATKRFIRSASGEELHDGLLRVSYANCAEGARLASVAQKAKLVSGPDEIDANLGLKQLLPGYDRVAMTADFNPETTLALAIHHLDYRGSLPRMVETRDHRDLADSAAFLPGIARFEPTFEAERFQADYWDWVISNVRVETALTLGQDLDAERKKLLSSPAIARMKHPHSRFLSDIAAPVRVKSSGGDFRQHREYTAGDDLRTVDWKATARTDKMQIKQYTDDEHRDLELLYDAESLFDRSTGATAKQNLLRHLILAERQGLNVAIQVQFRGASFRSENLVGSGRGGKQVNDGELSRLGDFLSSVSAVLDSERAYGAVYGSVAWNVFEKSHPQAEPGRIAFVSLSKGNAQASGHIPEMLQKRGVLVAREIRPRTSTPDAA